jgi:hypothetical protein
MKRRSVGLTAHIARSMPSPMKNNQNCNTNQNKNNNTKKLSFQQSNQLNDLIVNQLNLRPTTNGAEQRRT